MMRHHFQSQYFWSHCENKDDLKKNSEDDEKPQSLIGQDKFFLHKIDCFFIFVAISIICGFTLTVSSSFGINLVGGVNEVNDEVQDVPEKEVYAFNDILPLSYLLYLYPKIAKRSYTSVVKMKIKCKIATSRLVFHSSLHDIHTISLKSKDGRIGVTQKSRNTEKETMTLMFDDGLKVNETYELLIDVNGLLTFDRRHGIYLVKYNDEHGKEQ